MADVWFKKLGFGSNPFSIKPAAFSYELFGQNIGEVISGIDTGKVVFVEAPLGHGKTTLLKSIISRFGGRRKVIYAHAAPSQDIGVKELLKRSSLANFITGSLPSGMILVVDEAQNLLEGSSSEIVEFYKSGNIKSVVFFGTKYPDNGFKGELRAMMNGNLVRLSRPTPEQAISLIRSRIGNLPLISNEVILMAYRKAQGNPRRLLQVCEDMCRSAIEEGKFSVPPSKMLNVAPFATAEEPAVEKSRRVVRKKPRLARRSVAAKPAAPVVFHKPPEVEPVTYVTSVSESALGGAVTETKVVPAAAAHAPKHARKLRKKASAAAVAKKSPARKRKKSVLSKPIAKAAAAADVSDSSSESGHYWGEFMGMQK
ncbi:hypothetical protein HYU40_02885 [Candidatus Woesearchaeota archaeon]|nr:hypothetical protein [Candidatus Woesearchaeota archaeon]